ncbi:MAG: DUF1080 domain-containing protein [Acidobacteriota bacterium]|nr:DUF1080 domain-containing protein [Acidobacteriota bacterium]
MINVTCFLSTLALAVLIRPGISAEGPQPRVVVPGNSQPLAQPPSDAIVLFDGKDLSAWMYCDGRPAAWPIVDGALVSKSGTGNILSKRKIRSAQIHVEFATPFMPNAKGQARGNSGVYLQGRYEVQVLDSYQNPTSIPFTADRVRAERILADAARAHTKKIAELGEEDLKELERRYFMKRSELEPQVFISCASPTIGSSLRSVSSWRIMASARSLR